MVRLRSPLVLSKVEAPIEGHPFCQSEGCPHYFMYKVKFIFSKKGPMKYISHLDLMRLFMRALRRAELPLKMTEGFSPHPKLSLKRALKLGLESDNEEGSIVLKEQVNPLEFKDRLQKQLPEGIEIKNVEGNFN